MSTKPIKNLELYQMAADRVIYEKENGTFVWLPKSELESDFRRWNARYAGKGCGAVNPSGYLGIEFLFKEHGKFRVMAHRLAWFIVNGVIPELEIDHINRNKLDNRIANLRDVNKSVNLRNQPMHRNNTSGATGVFLDKKTKKWRGRVWVGDSLKNVGSFADFGDADIAVCKFRAKNGFSESHGRATP